MGSPAGAWGLDTRGGCSSPESRIPWACEEVGTPHNSEAEAGTQGALGGRSRRGAPVGRPVPPAPPGPGEGPGCSPHKAWSTAWRG